MTIKLVVNFCETPKTTHEIEEAGISRHAIYNAVRKNQLVNLRPGRKGYTECGLFVATESKDNQQSNNDSLLALQNAWR